MMVESSSYKHLSLFQLFKVCLEKSLWHWSDEIDIHKEGRYCRSVLNDGHECFLIITVTKVNPNLQKVCSGKLLYIL